MNLQDARVGEMVVMAMRDDYDIDHRYVGKMAGSFCVSLRAQPSKWRAAIFENRVEQYSEATRKFDVVAGMA